MRAELVLAELRSLGVELQAAGDRIRFRPVAAAPPALIEELRAHKPALLALLAAETWPRESPDAERSVGKRHARLYPFLRCTIVTPEGPGRLVQVFAERAGVELECRPREVSYLLPGELRPLGLPPLGAPDYGCEVH